MHANIRQHAESVEFYFMANIENSYPENVPGEFFVDSQCIDCDLCRQSAPAFFKRHFSGGASHSYVALQPSSPSEIMMCEDAMSACPVDAIGRSVGTSWRESGVAIHSKYAEPLLQ